MVEVDFVAENVQKVKEEVEAEVAFMKIGRTKTFTAIIAKLQVTRSILLAKAKA